MTEPMGRPRAETYQVQDLARLLADGVVRIPRFQRGLRWDARDVERLFDSIVEEFPIGTLLFWQREAPASDVVLGRRTTRRRRWIERCGSSTANSA